MKCFCLGFSNDDHKYSENVRKLHIHKKRDFFSLFLSDHKTRGDEGEILKKLRDLGLPKSYYKGSELFRDANEFILAIKLFEVVNIYTKTDQ